MLVDSGACLMLVHSDKQECDKSYDSDESNQHQWYESDCDGRAPTPLVKSPKQGKRIGGAYRDVAAAVAGINRASSAVPKT
jgi:hypothetical protein